MSLAWLDSRTSDASENGTGSLLQSTAVAIIDASEPATEQSEEGRPPPMGLGNLECFPIIEVAFNKEMWWSMSPKLSAELFAKCKAGQEARYTWEGRTYIIDFVRKEQRNLDNDRIRTIRVSWILAEDATALWTGQVRVA